MSTTNLGFEDMFEQINNSIALHFSIWRYLEMLSKIIVNEVYLPTYIDVIVIETKRNIQNFSSLG